MDKKASRPLPPSFMVSAPGKIILFGEHAAVYGKPALATAISLKSYLLVTTVPQTQGIVRLDFKDINLDHSWKIETLPWNASSVGKKSSKSIVDALDKELLEAVMPHAEAVSKPLPETTRKIHVRSATAFLYLFLSLASPRFSGSTYTLRSTIPNGAGLGSSASVCVCLSAALLLQTGRVTRPSDNSILTDAAAQVECVNHWAFKGELCLHGSPSGVDNTVSARGRAVLYQKDPSGLPLVTSLASFPKLPLILLDTQQSRSTVTQLENVKSLTISEPALTADIFEGISQLTSSALNLLSSPDFDGSDGSKNLEHLGSLMRKNHELLVSLGVSHPRLERVCQLIDSAKLGWTKLTGAGGGGCAIALLRSEVRQHGYEELERVLAAEGIQKYEIVLGVNGVGLLYPGEVQTTSRSASNVDLHKFQVADGVEEISSLIDTLADECSGWDYWAETSYC